MNSWRKTQKKGTIFTPVWKGSESPKKISQHFWPQKPSGCIPSFVNIQLSKSKWSQKLCHFPENGVSLKVLLDWYKNFKAVHSQYQHQKCHPILIICTRFGAIKQKHYSWKEWPPEKLEFSKFQFRDFKITVSDTYINQKVWKFACGHPKILSFRF